MPRLHSLRLDEFSDRELLALMIDLRDERGIVTSYQIADSLDPDAKHPTQCVGIRLGWLRRWQIVDRVDGGWKLTRKGEKIAAGELQAEQLQAIESLSAEQGLDAALALGQLYQRIGYSEAVMLRRGWQHAAARRRRTTRASSQHGATARRC
jgi:hypothetical protein